MDTRKVRLSGELQRGVYSRGTKDCRFGASFATVIFVISLFVNPFNRLVSFNIRRQVIIVLTQLEGSGGFSIAHRLTHRLANSRGLHDWGPVGATHCPAIDSVHGLHAPRMIT